MIQGSTGLPNENKDNEGKPAGPASVGVCLHVYALNLSKFAEVFPELLCRGGGEGVSEVVVVVGAEAAHKQLPATENRGEWGYQVPGEGVIAAAAADCVKC
ncbi:hypothetical protein E2C01_034582 [Portunus trituberculatus]|uniref:Uncharacterized protein n=1 Tax=Portunus trituberculatus TaxID=210409 RepID=A0A5B7F1Y0_PORTR|nr:hypothetical protein [Portunus trituberculatus]